MKDFFYRVKNKNEKITEGHIKALNFARAAKNLEAKGYTVLEIKEENQSSVSDNHKNLAAGELILSLQEKKEFFNSFYFMYKSGISINQIFNSIYNSSKNINIKHLCSYINKKIEKGNSLKESMMPFRNIIGRAYTMLIIAGEESGKLENVLSDIIKNISREEELHKNIISSLTYPACIVCLAFAVFLLFKFFVLKVFASIGDGIITSSTVMCMLITAIIKIVIIFAVIAGIIFYISKNKKLLQKILEHLFRLKIFSALLKNYYFSNFFFVAALAYDSGISAGESVNLANSVINIKEINAKIKKSADMILNGCKAGTALNVAGVFSSYAISQVSSGEEAGELDKTLRIIAKDYENKLDASLQVIMKLVEPILLIFVGILVLNIVVTAYKEYYSGLMSMF